MSTTSTPPDGVADVFTSSPGISNSPNSTGSFSASVVLPSDHESPLDSVSSSSPTISVEIDPGLVPLQPSISNSVLTPLTTTTTTTTPIANLTTLDTTSTASISLSRISPAGSLTSLTSSAKLAPSTSSSSTPESGKASLWIIPQGPPVSSVASGIPSLSISNNPLNQSPSLAISRPVSSAATPSITGPTDDVILSLSATSTLPTDLATSSVKSSGLAGGFVGDESITLSSSGSVGVSSARPSETKITSTEDEPLAFTTSTPSLSSKADAPSINPSTTFVSGSVTLTGAAAASAELAAAAEATSGSPEATTKKTDADDKSLSSVAIVGIVVGSLAGLVLVYVAWSQWRKRRARNSLGDKISDDPFDSLGSEKPRSPSDVEHDNDDSGEYRSRKKKKKGSRRWTEESFVADQRSDYAQTWYRDPYSSEPQPSEERQRQRNGTTSEDLRGIVDGLDDDGLVTAYGEEEGPGEVTTRIRMSGGIENPFVPPVPPLPSLYTGTPPGQVNSIPPRPPRVPTSYSFDDIYGGYSAPSRPGTTHTTHDPRTARRASELMTPSTSSLLPWRTEATPAPPVPPINKAFTTDDYHGRSHRQPRIPTPKTGKRRPPPPAQEDVRGPIVPMAQTPGIGLFEHGWTGVIPNFR